MKLKNHEDRILKLNKDKDEFLNMPFEKKIKMQQIQIKEELENQADLDKKRADLK